jgi:hypothetical protein
MTSSTTARLSQVVVGVGDLDAATLRMEAQGLTVVDGGRHPGVGTANRIIPLGDQYLELLGVVDRDQAATTEYGRSLMARTAKGDVLVRWSLRTGAIDEIAERLGLIVEPRQRQRPDGVLLTWRAAGLAAAVEDPWLPFFMQWDRDDQYPGLLTAAHPIGATGVAWLEVVPGDHRWSAWTGGAETRVRVIDGEPGFGRVAVITPVGETIVSIG